MNLNRIIENEKLKEMALLPYEASLVLYIKNCKIIGKKNYDAIGDKYNVPFPPVTAIVNNCRAFGSTSIILVHNHPSLLGLSRVVPSEEDVKLTLFLRKRLSDFGIKVEDHIILGKRNKHFSFKYNDLI